MAEIFRYVAPVRRVRILAFTFWSARRDSDPSKSNDRSDVFKSPPRIRVDTRWQALLGADRRCQLGEKPLTPPYNNRFLIPAGDPWQFLLRSDAEEIIMRSE